MKAAIGVLPAPAQPRPQQVRSRIAYLTSEQLEHFLKAAKDHGRREHAMFLFAVAHGARASEISNLRIADVNFKTEQVHVARLKGSLDSTQTLLRVKGSSLFNEPAVLKAWLDVRKPDADDYVFNSQKSTRLGLAVSTARNSARRPEKSPQRRPWRESSRPRDRSWELCTVCDLGKPSRDQRDEDRLSTS